MTLRAPLHRPTTATATDPLSPPLSLPLAEIFCIFCTSAPLLLPPATPRSTTTEMTNTLTAPKRRGTSPIPKGIGPLGRCFLFSNFILLPSSFFDSLHFHQSVRFLRTRNHRNAGGEEGSTFFFSRALCEALLLRRCAPQSMVMLRHTLVLLVRNTPRIVRGGRQKQNERQNMSKKSLIFRLGGEGCCVHTFVKDKRSKPSTWPRL